MKKFLTLCAVLIMTACATAPEIQPPETLSFKQYPPISINVARIEVIDEYKSPLKAPNVEHLIPYSPADATKIWVKDRLHAVGKENVLQVTIKDARVIATDLPKTPGFKGLYTNDQDKRYDAKLIIEMRIYEGGALSKADISASASYNFTMPEDASVAQRKTAFMRMISELMNTINSQLETNMFTYMNDYISRPRS